MPVARAGEGDPPTLRYDATQDRLLTQVALVMGPWAVFPSDAHSLRRCMLSETAAAHDAQRRRPLKVNSGQKG